MTQLLRFDRLVPLFLVAVVSVATLSCGTDKDSASASPTSASQATSIGTAVVPLPQAEDIARLLFGLIDDQRPSDAVGILAPELVATDAAKQAWAVQFAAFRSVQVRSVEPSNQAAWSGDSHAYKVILDVQMKPESVAATIPFYGWANGENVRWLSLTKVGGSWRISAIATGP